MYRKISEKSSHWNIRRIDNVLFLTAIMLGLLFMVINLFFKSVPVSRRADLLIDRECAELLGGDMVDTLIREFEEQNPELRIGWTTANGGSRGDNSSGAAEPHGEAGAVPPDIIFFDEARFSGLVRAEALISLNPYMRTETGAEHRAIPLVSFMDLLFYNIDILKAAGFNRPPKTRAEFFTYARAVAATNAGDDAKVYGAALSLGPDDPLALRRDVFSWIWAAGIEFPPDRAGRPLFESHTAIEVITFLRELNRERTLAPQPFAKTGADRIEEFAQGKIALMIASSRAIPLLKKRMGPALGITNIPGAPDAGKSKIALTGIYAGISGGCARPDDAWSFLTFLAEKGPAIAAGLEAVPGSLPGVFPGSEVFSGGSIPQDPLYSKAWDVFEASDITDGFSGHPHADVLERAAREALKLFFEQNSQSPADAAAGIQQRWDSLMP